MKVLKFGGTSVGTVESLLNVKSIVEGIDAPRWWWSLPLAASPTNS